MDAAVDTPGSFHDFKSTLWGNIYDHIVALPDRFIAVCDSAFETRELLDGKLIKLKSDNGGFAETSHEQSLTYL